MTTTASSTASSKRPAAPALPDELQVVLRRMRLPYVRAAAPEVLATAKAQRWEPAEVLRVLLLEEIRGRDAATQRMRRKAAGFPTGKTFNTWREHDSSIELRPNPPCGPWNGSGERRTSRSAARPELARATSSKPSRTPRSTLICGSPGSP